jgi:hypothetical protein
MCILDISKTIKYIRKYNNNVYTYTVAFAHKTPIQGTILL